MKIFLFRWGYGSLPTWAVVLCTASLTASANLLVGRSVTTASRRERALTAIRRPKFRAGTHARREIRILRLDAHDGARLQPYAVTIFAEMSALAARIGAVNLGQGFPDEDGPPAMLKVAENAIAEGVNQYPPGLGIAPLREAIAAQRKRHFGTEYDPDTEVLVTVGATEAIASAVLGLVEPGSEVLLIEPFYDSYSPVIAMAGCDRRAVPLMPDGRGFAIDVDGLRRAVTPRPRR